MKADPGSGGEGLPVRPSPAPQKLCVHSMTGRGCRVYMGGLPVTSEFSKVGERGQAPCDVGRVRPLKRETERKRKGEEERKESFS